MGDQVASADGGDDLHLQELQFTKDLEAFMQKRGTPIPPPPLISGKPFSIWALYKQVTQRGGLETVLKDKLWGSIVQSLNMPSECLNPSYTLRVLYLKYLYAYERKHFLEIDTDETPVDFTPKPRNSSSNSHSGGTGAGSASKSQSSGPLTRPVLKHDYRRTPLPTDSSRLRNKVKDTLQQQRIGFALQSGSPESIEWALELFALKSHEGEILIRSNDDNTLPSIGVTLLTALIELAKDFYTDSTWKSEKYPNSPNEMHVLAIIHNLTLVPQNEIEMASHRGCVEFLVQCLAHPTSSCVEDALETLISLSDHLVLVWEADSKSTNETINAETSKTLVLRLCNLLCDGFTSAIPILASLTSNPNNWPALEDIICTTISINKLFDSLESLIHSNDDKLSTSALKVIFNISKYGIKTRKNIATSKGIMQFLFTFLAAPRGEEDIEEECVIWVLSTILNLVNDPAVKECFQLYELELLNLLLLENTYSEAIASALAALADS